MYKKKKIIKRIVDVKEETKWGWSLKGDKKSMGLFIYGEFVLGTQKQHYQTLSINQLITPK